MQNSDTAVPVFIISGFLGSGKTTLLIKWLDWLRQAGRKPAVVMNELGDVNLDGLAVGDVPMAEMLGGCICCTIRGDLGLTLTGLVREQQPDIVIIESTGAANPLDMIDGITEVSLYEPLRLQAVISLVDAPQLMELHVKGKGSNYRLMREQIRCADLLLLNKLDQVHAAQTAELEAIVRDWNGYAPLLRTVCCELDFALLDKFAAADSTGHSVPADSEPTYCNVPAESERTYHNVSVETDPAYHNVHADSEPTYHNVSADSEPTYHNVSADSKQERHIGDHPHHAAAYDLPESHHTHSHVMAYTCYLDGPVDSERFERFVAGLPECVLRAKGVLTFSDTGGSRFLFQYAYRQPDYMRITPQQQVADVLVLIGEHMPIDELRLQLDALVLPE